MDEKTIKANFDKCRKDIGRAKLMGALLAIAIVLLAIMWLLK